MSEGPWEQLVRLEEREEKEEEEKEGFKPQLWSYFDDNGYGTIYFFFMVSTLTESMALFQLIRVDGQRIYGGEILGKHSEEYFYPDNFEFHTDDKETIDMMEENGVRFYRKSRGAFMKLIDNEYDDRVKNGTSRLKGYDNAKVSFEKLDEEEEGDAFYPLAISMKFTAPGLRYV